MIFAANGQYRSGSTLAYNLLKDIAPARALGGKSPQEAEVLVRGGHARHYTIKVHTWWNAKAYCVYTFRHPIGRLVSGLSIDAWQGRSTGERYAKALAAVKLDSEIFLQQLKHPEWPVLMLKYEDLLGEEVEMARRIAEFIGSPINVELVADRYTPDKVMRLTKELRKQGKEACEETEFRVNHISRAVFELPDKVRKQCLDDNKEFLRAAGY